MAGLRNRRPSKPHKRAGKRLRFVPDPALSLPRPHAGQEQFLALTGRYRVAICGRRFGKTVVGCLTVVDACEKATRPLNIFWVAPKQAQANRVERQLIRWLKANKKRAREWKHLKVDHVIEHRKSKSRIEFHSAHDPDNLRGPGLDLCVIDEAADVSEYCWTDVIRPALIERQGDAVMLGTPRGQNNWLHGLFLRSLQPGQYASLQLPSHANPLLPREELDELKAEMTEATYRQEILAEFVAGINAVFKNVDACQYEGAFNEEPRKTARHVTGIDLGLRASFTAICTIDTFNRRVIAYVRFQKTDWEDTIRRIIAHLQRYKGPAYIDSTGVGDPIVERITRKIPTATGVRFTETRREQLITALALRFAQTDIYVNKRAAALIAELHAFIYREDAHGRFRPAAAPGATDDGVMALALANSGLRFHNAPNAVAIMRKGFFK